MGWGGPHAGSHFGGHSAAATSSAAGLPFAGIPSELVERVEAILDTEPDHRPPQVEFRPAQADPRPFTLRRFLARHRWAMTGGFLLVVVETLAMQAGPLLTQRGIDDGVVAGDRDALVAIGAAYLISIVVATGTSALRVAWTGRVGERLMEELRVRIFTHFQRLSLDFFTGERAGRLMTRMTSDIESLTALFHDGLVNLAVQGLTLVVITVVLFIFSPLLTVIMLVVVVPAMLALTLWFRTTSDREYGRVRDRIADVLADLSEGLAGVRVVTHHNRRRHNVVAHRNVVGEYRDANVATARTGSLYGSASEGVGLVGQALILLVGGRMVLDRSLTIGELTAFMLYLTAFFAPIQQLVQLFNTYQQGQAAVAKLRDLLATEPTVGERPGAATLPPVHGAVRFDDVSFAYVADQPVLDHVDLEIAAGETFALVGPTGAGKSTLAKLVTRFHDPTAGTVSIDGHDLRDVTLHSLRSQLGIVPQEPFLFYGSVHDNVAFARPDATDDEVWEACRAVGVDDVVARLPDGLDTAVHERGASLSSGERQLLALARVFLARPRVLVLDEATSSLDMRSEARIERGLDALLEGRTAIVIAHRLATAMRADRIAVVDHGGIVELGSHAELVAHGGAYAAMFSTWERHGNGRTAVHGTDHSR